MSNMRRLRRKLKQEKICLPGINKADMDEAFKKYKSEVFNVGQVSQTREDELLAEGRIGVILESGV